MPSISNLFLLSALLLVLTSVQAFESKILENEDDLKPLSFTDAFSGKFSPKGFTGTWTSRNEFTYLADDGLREFNFETKSENLLLDRENLVWDDNQWRFSSLTLSPTKTKLLIRYDEQPLRLNQRFFSIAVYYLNSNRTLTISDNKDVLNSFWENGRDQLFYVKLDSVYNLDLSDFFSTPEAIQIKSQFDDILYGIGDWTYYETVFKKTEGVWSSPRGLSFAYIALNSTEVSDYTYVEYGEPDDFDLYPSLVTYKYPKAGTKIPQIELKVVSTATSSDVHTFYAPKELGDEPILASVGWVDDYHVAPMWMNRAQTVAIVQSCKFTSNEEDPSCEIIIQMEEPNGWLEPDTLICSQSPTVRKKCWIKGHVQGWQRLLEIDMGTKVAYAITPKESTLVEKFGMDEMREEVFVIISGDSIDPVRGPIVRHLYKIPANGQLECISCKVVSPEGNNCTYAAASFSKDLSHFAFTCRGPDPSYTVLFANGDQITQTTAWEENESVRQKLKRYQKTIKLDVRIPIGSDDSEYAMAHLYLPPCIDQEASKKYPMVVRVMGDENYAQVTDIFSFSYAHYQAQTRGVIPVFLDARGSGFKGNDILFAVKNKLGLINAEDNINAVKYLVKNYKFIDPNRIGIWGYGYGGYAAAMTLAMDDEGIFQGGFSVSPVTSFFRHTAIYTDRLMGTPGENREVYEATDLLQFASKIHGKKYLLVHGTADDSYHYEHSMLWAKALQKAGVIFDQMTYPDANHRLANEDKHLHETIDEFWTKTIRVTPWDGICDK